MRLDHVTIAGLSLPRMEETFRRAGLETRYGGPHSNGATHMALLGFDDGSYIELISLVETGDVSPLWHRQIVEDGGPAAWAVVVEDINAEVDRLRALDVPVRGPVNYHRIRPDGVSVEWELAFPGEGPPGAVLPFLIRDRSPRAVRVTPSPSVAGSELAGVEAIVLAVRDRSATAAVFDRCYGGGAAIEVDAPAFGARLARLPGGPVILAEPLPGDDRLSNRIEQFGESPCACLVRTRDLEATRLRLGLRADRIEREGWFGRPILWMPPSIPSRTGSGAPPIVPAPPGSAPASGHASLVGPASANPGPLSPSLSMPAPMAPYTLGFIE